MVRHHRLLSIVLMLPLLISVTPTTVRAQSATVVYIDKYPIVEAWMGMGVQAPPELARDLAFSGAFFPRETFGYVGEVSLYTNEGATAVDSSGHAVLGGVRFRTPALKDPDTELRLFAQALTGPQWANPRGSGPVFQPGAGVDAYLRNHDDVMVHVDYSVRLALGIAPTRRVLVGVGLTCCRF